MEIGDKVCGLYGGVEYSGVICHIDPNWENGSFEKSIGIHLHVELDSPLNNYKIGRFYMNDDRRTIMFEAWHKEKKYEFKTISLKR